MSSIFLWSSLNAASAALKGHGFNRLALQFATTKLLTTPGTAAPPWLSPSRRA
jgi:hypothetical protein